MSGPYDFIGQESESGGFWSKQLKLSELFANPLVIGADFAMTGLMYKPLWGSKALQKSMDPAQWSSFTDKVRSFNKLGSGANVGEDAFRKFVLKAGPKDIGMSAAKVGGTFGRDMAFQEGMVEKFGVRAAGRLSFARAATGLSRFMLWYTALDAGIGIMKSYAEAAGSYQKPSRANPTRQLETGGVMFDTRHAQTQRMRSIQAIHNTQLSTRAAMGNEAAFMHMA